jgi:hypothetical protein
MKLKIFVMPALLASSLLANGQALAEHKLTTEQLIKARQSASQLNPPVDFDALIKVADRLGVECTGDLTRKARIIICGQKVENAQIRADTEATRVKIKAIEADTEAIRARNKQIDEENAELIRDVQRRIKENK